MKLFDLVKQLIQIESISGNEQQIADFLFSNLKHLGFNVDFQEVCDGRKNVYARHGDPQVVLSTHMDTVAPFIDFAKDKQFIYGRGSCDAKGIIAAQMKAAEQLLTGGYSNFGLLFVVDEEEISRGAVEANKIPNQCKYLINGEPTGNKMARGSKGSLRFKIITKGKAAHSAYPEMGESAIEKLLDILNDIRNINWPGHDILGETLINIGTIRGGIQANVIPPQAEALFLLRIVTSVSEIKALIEKAVNGRGQIEYLSDNEPVFTEALDGYETMVAAFTTDIPKLTNWGKPILFGPGDILDAHTDHERISKQQLLNAVDMYKKMVIKLLSF
ncbi:MAG: M20/M25/M40 family metallo-hydrolase [Calditrichaceae bacterium]|nr:M20/M25/M40 family metallo-hydrolase [Calditrichaceae bacterium]